MPTCFVIQPFSREFDQRYRDVYQRALEDAGLEPYRVDQDPSAEKIYRNDRRSDPQGEALPRRHHDRQS